MSTLPPPPPAPRQRTGNVTKYAAVAVFIPLAVVALVFLVLSLIGPKKAADMFEPVGIERLEPTTTTTAAATTAYVPMSTIVTAAAYTPTPARSVEANAILVRSALASKPMDDASLALSILKWSPAGLKTFGQRICEMTTTLKTVLTSEGETIAALARHMATSSGYTEHDALIVAASFYVVYCAP